jgi:hypothetical protein
MVYLVNYLVKRALSNEQIKADILNRLVNSEAFGRYHIPFDQMKNWVQNRIMRNGKKVSKCIEDLVRAGLVIRSARDTIYADQHRLDEIFAYIDTNLKL